MTTTPSPLKRSLLSTLLIASIGLSSSGCIGTAEGASSATPAAVLAKNGITIYDAARTGNLDAISFLIGDGVDIDAPDSTGSTALHYAATAGHARAVRLLLIAGANRDIEDASSRTALQIAQDAGKSEVVRQLASETILP